MAACSYLLAGSLAFWAFLGGDEAVKASKDALTLLYVKLETADWEGTIRYGAVATDRILSRILGHKLLSLRAFLLWLMFIASLWFFIISAHFFANRPSMQPYSVTFSTIRSFWIPFASLGATIDFTTLTIGRLAIRRVRHVSGAIVFCSYSVVAAYISFALFIDTIPAFHSVLFVYSPHMLTSPFDYFAQQYSPGSQVASWLVSALVVILASFSNILFFCILGVVVVVDLNRSAIRRFASLVVERAGSDKKGVFVIAGGFAILGQILTAIAKVFSS